MLQHPVPKTLLVHIGDITVSFALLEANLQLFIGSLIREHQAVGRIITAECSFRGLRALAASLYLERHGRDDDYKILQSLLKRAGQLEDKRNAITHSVWGAGNSPGTITRIKVTAKEKHGLRHQFENVHAEALKSIADDIKKLANDLQRFHLDLMDRGKAVNNPLRKLW